MTTNSEARKRLEERQANYVCKTVEFEGAKRDTVTNRCDCGEDTIIGCGSRPDRHCGLNAEPDTVTIEISREDAESVVRDFPEASADFAFGRVALACRAALEGER